jgi:hypothetical protein
VEERRGPVRRALSAALVALAIGSATAEACEIPRGFAPTGRAESAGVTVIFRTLPPAIELGRHFTVEALVCGEGAPPVLTRIDAHMPEHRHGMNYRPTLSAKGDGRYVAEGLLFHMPGRWEFVFDVETGGRRTRLATDMEVE